jgi:phosphoglycolate phosphatase
MAFDLAIFDFDGTLADTIGWFAQSINVAASRFGFRSLTKEQFDDVRGFAGTELLKRLEISAETLPVLARFVQELAASQSHRFSLFPGTGDLLTKLRRAGIKVAIVSSNAEPVVTSVLGVDLVVDFLECDAGFFGKKAVYERVIAAAGTIGASTIAIGDEGRDIDAAVAAGVVAGAVSWGFATREYLASLKPDFIFDSVDAIEALLLPPANVHGR